MEEEKVRIESSRESNAEKLKASIEMSKFADVAMGRSDLLNSATLLSSILGKETGNGGGSIVARALTKDLEGSSSVAHSKAKT